jgi:queuine tRNA-ribosyltransferase
MRSADPAQAVRDDAGIGALLEIRARDGDRARAGVLRVAHGVVRVPAFVPLATKGAVKGLEPRDLVALGYDMVLGNAFHIGLQPGEDLVAELGGLHAFMGWPRPIITDSGGFQVFSMGHGTVADEVKGRAPSGPERAGSILAIEEAGVRFRSYVDGAERFMGPESSMAIQAALGSDIALAFDECTPFHVSRDYTERSTARTHRWLTRCLRWHGERGSARQAVYGIVQGGVHEDLRRESAETVAASGCAGIAIGGSLGRDKQQMHEVVDLTTAALERAAPERPRHLLGIGEVDDLIRGVELGVDTFDCAMPTRLGRHGVALVADPRRRWRSYLVNAAGRRDPAPLMEGCACPACAPGYARGYLAHLIRIREQTGPRLLTLHNLHFIARLMDDLRAAVAEGRLAERAAALRAGDVPRGLGG